MVISGGFEVSTVQLRTVPVSSFASNFRKQCGFAHSHSVTVPFSVISLSVSKLAVPWCAKNKNRRKLSVIRPHLTGAEGAGLAKRVGSIAALGCTDVNSYLDRPSSQITVHLNGIFTPATSR